MEQGNRYTVSKKQNKETEKKQHSCPPVPQIDCTYFEISSNLLV